MDLWGGFGLVRASLPNWNNYQGPRHNSPLCALFCRRLWKRIICEGGREERGRVGIELQGGGGFSAKIRMIQKPGRVKL